MEKEIEQIETYLNEGKLPPLPVFPYDECLIREGGIITEFWSRRLARKYREEHNCWT